MKEEGDKKGQEIAEVLEERDMDRVIPLYRSAIIINKTDKGIQIESWGTPKDNEEVEDDTISDDPDHKYLLSGTKHGGRIYVYLPEDDEWDEMFPLETAKFILDKREENDDQVKEQ